MPIPVIMLYILLSDKTIGWRDKNKIKFIFNAPLANFALSHFMVPPTCLFHFTIDYWRQSPHKMFFVVAQYLIAEYIDQEISFILYFYYIFMMMTPNVFHFNYERKYHNYAQYIFWEINHGLQHLGITRRHHIRCSLTYTLHIVPNKIGSMASFLHSKTPTPFTWWSLRSVGQITWF